MQCMRTPTRSMRIPEPLEAAARAGAPELAGLGIGELVRAALALAAGHSVKEAVAIAHGVRGQALAAPESPVARPGREVPAA
jgi:hypothetical protein